MNLDRSNEMKKATGLYLGLGLIAIIITLVIFFVPRMEELEAVYTIEWTKLGIILASLVIMFLALIISSKSKSTFTILSISSFTTSWFILNLILTLFISTMQALIIWTAVLFLIYVAILLFLSFAGGTIKADENRERKLMEESKNKNLLNKKGD